MGEHACEQSVWKHEGPDGPDLVEWWTMTGAPIGVTRQRDGEYVTAYVDDGTPSPACSDGRTSYPQLDEAQRAANATSAWLGGEAVPVIDREDYRALFAKVLTLLCSCGHKVVLCIDLMTGGEYYATCGDCFGGDTPDATNPTVGLGRTRADCVADWNEQASEHTVWTGGGKCILEANLCGVRMEVATSGDGTCGFSCFDPDGKHLAWGGCENADIAKADAIDEALDYIKKANARLLGAS